MQTKTLYQGERLITERLLICQNFYERARGLLWRKRLDPSVGEALLIPRCNSVHTAFMGYAIDVIFMDRRGQVTSIRCGLPPWRAAVDLRASFVVECAENTAWVRDLLPGQVLRWQGSLPETAGA
jgi:uncharacterized membrane protein (UPF0127 family)